MEDSEKVVLNFAAIDKKIAETLPKLTQESVNNKEYVSYGEKNDYPEFLFSLFNDVTTLKTIIEGSANYIAGDDVIGNIPGFEVTVNHRGDTFRDLVQNLAKDWLIYGGCSYQVIRNNAGGISELYYLDFRYLRTDKKNESFWYSEEYGKKYVRSTKTVVYPKYIPNGDAPSSIVYLKNTTSTPYPIPRYSGAIKCCEIERRIDNMHLNGLTNGFMPSFMIGFNQGTPSPEQKAQIEKDVEEKFCGDENTGRILLSFANGKENQAVIQKIDVQDFGDKYQAAAKRSREMIYTAFGANPCLFGLNTESNGFSEIEFVESFNLYNSTTIRGIQRMFGDSFDKVFGKKGSVTFKPFVFTTKESNTNNNNTTNVN